MVATGMEGRLSNVAAMVGDWLERDEQLECWSQWQDKFFRILFVPVS
jgi:hypothetical protein